VPKHNRDTLYDFHSVPLVDGRIQALSRFTSVRKIVNPQKFLPDQSDREIFLVALDHLDPKFKVAPSSRKLVQ
jgi:hypothetical protein